MATSTRELLDRLRQVRTNLDSLIREMEGPGDHATARMQCAWCNVDEGESHIFGCPVLSLLEDR